MWLIPPFLFGVLCLLISASAFFIGVKTRPMAVALTAASLNFVTIYVTILVDVFIFNINLEQQLSICDLDKNGMFSANEMTEECRVLSGVWANDVGRNLAPVTGFVFSFCYSLLYYFLLRIGYWIQLKSKATTKHK